MKREMYASLESQCERVFEENGPFWHLYTPGENVETLFADKNDLIFGMNLMSLCLMLNPELEIYTHTLMNNHIHVILNGRKEYCLEFFSQFKKRLQRYLANNGRNVDLSKFDCSLLRIETLQSLRNEIVYVNRNGYVVNSRCTPYTYFWGAGLYFFNTILKGALKLLAKRVTPTYGRKVFRTRDIIDTNSLLFYNDIALPTSYCSIEKAESLFRDAHQYFNMLSKSWEAYSAISARLGDSVFLTDEEMYGAISSYTTRYYNQKRPSNLTPKEKLEVAKVMHSEYNASNRQIKSILKLDASIVQEMFPMPKW